MILGNSHANLPNFAFLNLLHSARESPVAWEGESVEDVDNNRQNQPGGPESHSSPGPNQAQRKWEAEEETKNEQTQHEDEGSTSGVGDCKLQEVH